MTQTNKKMSRNLLSSKQKNRTVGSITSIDSSFKAIESYNKGKRFQLYDNESQDDLEPFQRLTSKAAKAKFSDMYYTTKMGKSSNQGNCNNSASIAPFACTSKGVEFLNSYFYINWSFHVVLTLNR